MFRFVLQFMGKKCHYYISIKRNMAIFNQNVCFAGHIRYVSPHVPEHANATLFQTYSAEKTVFLDMCVLNNSCSRSCPCITAMCVLNSNRQNQSKLNFTLKITPLAIDVSIFCKFQCVHMHNWYLNSANYCENSDIIVSACTTAIDGSRNRKIFHE